MSTYEASTPMLTTESQTLPRELSGEQITKRSRVSDDKERRPRVALYAERLRQGLDLWTGESSNGALQESALMRSREIQAERGVRRHKANNNVDSV